MKKSDTQPSAIAAEPPVGPPTRPDAQAMAPMEPERRPSILDLKGCLAGRRTQLPTADLQTVEAGARDVADAAEAESEAANEAPNETDVERDDPPVDPDASPAPEKTLSVWDLRGCLAGRRPGPPPTIEEIHASIWQGVMAQWMRGAA